MDSNFTAKDFSASNMSTVDELKVRYVVQAKLLGQDKGAQKKGRVSDSMCS